MWMQRWADLGEFNQSIYIYIYIYIHTHENPMRPGLPFRAHEVSGVSARGLRRPLDWSRSSTVPTVPVTRPAKSRSVVLHNVEVILQKQDEDHLTYLHMALLFFLGTGLIILEFP